MGNEVIGIGFRPVFSGESNSAPVIAHAFLVYYSSDGVQYFGGGPSAGGLLEAYYEPLSSSSFDYRWIDANAAGYSKPFHYEGLIEGENLSEQWNAIGKVAARICAQETLVGRLLGCRGVDCNDCSGHSTDPAIRPDRSSARPLRRDSCGAYCLCPGQPQIYTHPNSLEEHCHFNSHCGFDRRRSCDSQRRPWRGHSNRQAGLGSGRRWIGVFGCERGSSPK